MMQTWQIWGLIGWLLISAAARADEPATQPAVYDSASTVARITFRQGSMQVSPDLVKALLRSTAVLQAAAKDIAGLPVGWEQSVLVRVERTGPSMLTDAGVENVALEIEVALMDIPGASGGRPRVAQQLLAGLSRELQKSMLDAGVREMQRLNEAVAASEQASAEAQARFKELQARQQQLLEAAGRVDLSRERVADEQNALEMRLRDVELRLVSQRARQTALSEQIAKLGKDVGATVDSNSAVTELAKIAQLRERAWATALERQKAGLISQQEVDEQEEQLARARAELAQQRQVAAQAAGGALLADLNRGLLQQSVDLAETEAERGAVAQLLDEMRARKLLDLADQYQREVQMLLPSAGQAVEDAGRQLLRAVNERNRYQAPQVVILGQGQ